MTHLAITGIGGFIGSRMAERALAKGWTVSGLDQSAPATARISALGANITIGDINDSDKLHAAFTGADWVFHTAAVVTEDGPRELFERVNNQGTHSVCQAAQHCGVKQLIHLSSVMVYGFDYPDNVTEDGPFADHGNIYNETKLSSERIALEYHQPDNNFNVIIIRPGDVYGARGSQWVLRPLEMIRHNQFALPNGGRGVINHVHVDNLLDGVLLAHENNPGGQAFNITDDTATPCHTFFQYHANMAGKPRLFSLPASVMKSALWLTEMLLKPFGKQPPARAAGVNFLLRKHKVCCEKAKQQLGYQPKISLKQGMQNITQALQ